MGNAETQSYHQKQCGVLEEANFSEKDIKRIYKRFRFLDTNKNGVLDLDELMGITEMRENPLLRRVVSVFDTDGDGKVSFIEFLVGLAKLTAGVDSEQKMRFAFDIYDMNKDGYISNGELFTVMKCMVGTNLNNVQLQQLVDRTVIEADTDHDGMISFDEFFKIVSPINIPEKISFDV